MTSDAVVFLRALHVYDTWHTPGFLVGKGLLNPEWPASHISLVATELAMYDLIQVRYSESRKCLMYKITLAGAECLRELDRVKERV